MKTIIEQFNSMNELPIFEIEVINKETSETDYIIFNIETDKQHNTFNVYHIPLTKEEQHSKHIPNTILNIDDDVTLDTHLEQLYEDCINDIINSDFYTLP